MLSCRNLFRTVLATLVLLVSADLAFADIHCKAVAPHEPSPAEKAYLDGNMSQAESLYRDDLTKAPHDTVAVAGLTRTLLREQKVNDASAIITAELAAAPDSVPLIISKAEVLYRQGKVAEAAGAADQAFRSDPCSARLYLLRARIFRLNSMYASERRAIGFAYSLDPTDLEIRRVWLGTLSLTQRIEQQKAFLAVPGSVTGDEREKLEKGLKNLEYFATLTPKSCHVASAVTSTEIALAPIEYYGNSGRGTWGLHMQFNKADATLGVDTGASGIVINRAIADRAGLKAGERLQIGGVGDQGVQGAYKAQVDSIRIGALEFKDCTVQVTDRKDILGTDGLIGADVFSNYLVTLDYPMRKFLLSPLPPRPSDTSDSVGSLSTGGTEQSGAGAMSDSNEPQDRYMSPTMKDYSPVFRSGHFLIVPVTLNGKETRLFIVDTGAFSTSISPEAARAVTRVSGGDAGSVRGMSGAVAKVQFSQAIDFRFAGIEQQNNDLVTFDTVGVSQNTGVEISGFLGSTLLRQLTISIDYRDGLVKFDYDSHHGNHSF
jgi:predicted aspartyl protease